MHRLIKRIHPQRIRRTMGAASTVREPVRFAITELRNAPAVSKYRLRRSDLLAHVRHPLLDMWLLEEIFRFRVYEPPPSAMQALREIGRPIRIVDLGGHVGYFGLFMRQLFPDASVLSFEPDPENVLMLKRCIDSNRLQENWQVIEACASTREDSVDFVSGFHLSRIVSSSDPASSDPALDEMRRRISGAFPFLEDADLLKGRQRRVRCVDVFPSLMGADLIKIDIEGSEWELLADPRLSELSAAAAVLEYHPSYGPGPDALRTVRRELETAGYQTGAAHEGEDAGTIWAWKTTRQASQPGS